MSEVKKKQSYENDQIQVGFDPNICAHAGKCVRNLKSVFDLKGRPWINVNGDTPDAIVDLIKTCPSGALTYTLKNAEAEEKEEAVVTVTVSNSLKIEGKVRIVDREGNLIRETEKCSFCRCGHSKVQPFCDGSHKEHGWQG